MAYPHPNVSDRFWSKAVKRPDGCWLWNGAKHSTGYGLFWLDGSNRLANRVSYWLTHGVWPNMACHTCDVRLCVNPDHIYDGDSTSNIGDMVRRGRHGFGSRSHCSKGHEYTDKNTYIVRSRGFMERQCRTCTREYRARSVGRRRSNGLCMECGAVSASYRCDACRAKHATRERERAPRGTHGA